MKKLLIVFVAVLFTATAVARDIILVRDGSDTYIIHKVDGQLKLEKVTKEIKIGGKDEPEDPELPPDVEDELGLKAIARVAFQEVPEYDDRLLHAQSVAQIYSSIAESHASYKDIKSLKDDTSTSLSLLFTAIGNKDKWDKFGGKVGPALARLETAGKIKTPADAAKAYREIAAGLLDSKEARAEANGEIIAAVIQMVIAVRTKNPVAIASAVQALVQAVIRHRQGG